MIRKPKSKYEVDLDKQVADSRHASKARLRASLASASATVTPDGDPLPTYLIIADHNNWLLIMPNPNNVWQVLVRARWVDNKTAEKRSGEGSVRIGALGLDLDYYNNWGEVVAAAELGPKTRRKLPLAVQEAFTKGDVFSTRSLMDVIEARYSNKELSAIHAVHWSRGYKKEQVSVWIDKK